MIEGCDFDTDLFFARLTSSECQCSPEGPGDHDLEGQLSKAHIENHYNFILATRTVETDQDFAHLFSYLIIYYFPYKLWQEEQSFWS